MVWKGVQGESRREHGPSVHHLKGAQPQGLSEQSPYFEENNQQKFSPIQMYLEGYFGKSFFDYSIHPFYLSRGLGTIWNVKFPGYL